MNFAFRDGSRLRGDAQSVGIELTRIHEEEGRLVAPDVVKAAEPEEAPLHPYFEWDDSLAAQEYRCEQARRLIRSVVIMQEPEDTDAEPPKLIRAFFNVTPEDEASYEPVHTVLSEDKLRSQILKSVYGEIEAARQKLLGIQEYSPIVDDLSCVQRKIQERLDV